MSANRKGGSKLRIEGLENRLMMAGNVTATLQAGNLLITGNALDNGVSIIGSAVPGKFVVQGLPTNCVPTTVNGKHSVTFEKVQNITIDLKDGNDLLRIGNAQADQTQIPGMMTARTGPGNDTVIIENAKGQKSFALDTGNGDDTVIIRDSVFRDLTVNLGLNNDSLTFRRNTLGVEALLNGGTGTSDGRLERDALNNDLFQSNSGYIRFMNFEAYV
jgi:hypothetical protein